MIMRVLSLFIISGFLLIACSVGPELECDLAGFSRAEDSQKLQELFSQIEELSLSVSCDDPSEWLLAPYGTKACGGSQGYIAYSNKINDKEILELIELYTDTESTFNQLWGVISDCAVVSSPSYVICRDNLPVMIFNCPFRDNDTTSRCNDIPPTDEECDAAFTRWFFVRSSNTCELLEYSGCDQHGFATQEECDQCPCTEG